MPGKKRVLRRGLRGHRVLCPGLSFQSTEFRFVYPGFFLSLVFSFYISWIQFPRLLLSACCLLDSLLCLLDSVSRFLDSACISPPRIKLHITMYDSGSCLLDTVSRLLDSFSHLLHLFPLLVLSYPSLGFSFLPPGFSFPSLGYSFPSLGFSFPSLGLSFAVSCLESPPGCGTW